MKYLQNTFFNIFFIIVSLIAGAFFTSWTITDKTGFAGGAAIFWGGAIGAFLGLITAIIAKMKIKNSAIRNIISVLGFLTLLGSIIFLKLQEIQ